MVTPPREVVDWVVRAIAVVLAVLLVWSWNSGRTAKEGLSQALERERLEKAELLVQIELSKKEISQREKELLMANADLEVEVARLKDIAGKVKIVEVVKWQTNTVTVEVPGVERPCVPGPDGKPMNVLLAQGDTGHAEVAELTYKTDDNNYVIIGKASCIRDTPSRQLLFTSVIEAPVSVGGRLHEAAPPRWGAGAYVGFSKDGWAVGPEVAFPPLRLFSLQFEVNAGVGLGPGGQFQGGLSGVFRW